MRTFQKPRWRIKTVMLALLLVASAWTRPLVAGTAAHPALGTVEAYVRDALRGQPGEVGVTAGPIDPRLRLPACSAYEAFTPSGVRLLGNVNIGVRCLGPSRWSIFVPTRISVRRAYVATAVALPAGRKIERQDLQSQDGDLGQLPVGVLTDAEAAIGKVLKIALAAGQPLRQELLMAPRVIRRGQPVRLIYRGEGFTASNEGQALNEAAVGQPVQVKTRSGMVVGGVADAEGNVQVGDVP